MNKEQLAESREVDYRLSKWIITNIEQLLSPEEIEEIWRELLSFYSPPTASVENVCGTMTGNGLGKYVVPSKSDMIVEIPWEEVSLIKIDYYSFLLFVETKNHERYMMPYGYFSTKVSREIAKYHKIEADS